MDKEKEILERLRFCEEKLEDIRLQKSHAFKLTEEGLWFPKNKDPLSSIASTTQEVWDGLFSQTPFFDEKVLGRPHIPDEKPWRNTLGRPGFYYSHGSTNSEETKKPAEKEEDLYTKRARAHFDVPSDKDVTLAQRNVMKKRMFAETYSPVNPFSRASRQRFSSKEPNKAVPPKARSDSDQIYGQPNNQNTADLCPECKSRVVPLARGPVMWKCSNEDCTFQIPLKA